MLMKTYAFKSSGREQTVRAWNANDALDFAIRETRSKGHWQPDDGSEHTIVRRVSVVCVDDEYDSATESAQMWP
jgi:hypothetical protein